MRTHAPNMKGNCPMTNKEKLIQFVETLTYEEAEKIIAYLESASSPETIVPLLPPNTVPQEQEVSV